MTRERLRNYRALRLELAQLRQMEESLESAMYSPQELLAHYKKKESELEVEQMAIEQAIESLDHKKRTMMRYYYIEGLTWEEVCSRMYYSLRHMHRIHKEALDELSLK